MPNCPWLLRFVVRGIVTLLSLATSLPFVFELRFCKRPRFWFTALSRVVPGFCPSPFAFWFRSGSHPLFRFMTLFRFVPGFCQWSFILGLKSSKHPMFWFMSSFPLPRLFVLGFCPGSFVHGLRSCKQEMLWLLALSLVVPGCCPWPSCPFCEGSVNTSIADSWHCALLPLAICSWH